MVDEFIIAKIAGRYHAVSFDRVLCCDAGSVEEANRAAMAELGGEWERELEGNLYRYRRKPSPSDAERVAREIHREIQRLSAIEAFHSEDSFAKRFAPLIATVNAAEREDLEAECELLRERLAELEAELAAEKEISLAALDADYVRWRKQADAYRAAVEFALTKCYRNAGSSTENEFTYLWKKDWLEFERLAEAALKEPEVQHVA